MPFLHGYIQKLRDYLNKAKKNDAYTIKAPSYVKEILASLRVCRQKNTILDAKAVAEVGTQLANGGADICCRIDGDIFQVVVEMLLQCEASCDAQRTIYLLAASIHRDHYSSNYDPPIAQARKDLIGKLCLHALCGYFVDTNKHFGMRRVVGILCLQLVQDSEANIKKLGLLQDANRRGLGLLVCEESDEILRAMAGTLVGVLIANEMALDKVFPAALFTQLPFQQFPIQKSKDDDIWTANYQNFIEKIIDKGAQRELPVGPVGDLFFARCVKLEPERTFSVSNKNVYVFVEEQQISFWVPSRTGSFDQTLSIPLSQIAGIIAYPGQQSQSGGTEFHLQIGEEEENYCFLNSAVASLNKVGIYLSFPGDFERFRECVASERIFVQEGKEVADPQNVFSQGSIQVSQTNWTTKIPVPSQHLEKDSDENLANSDDSVEEIDSPANYQIAKILVERTEEGQDIEGINHSDGLEEDMQEVEDVMENVAGGGNSSQNTSPIRDQPSQTIYTSEVWNIRERQSTGSLQDEEENSTSLEEETPIQSPVKKKLTDIGGFATSKVDDTKKGVPPRTQGAERPKAKAPLASAQNKHPAASPAAALMFGGARDNKDLGTDFDPESAIEDDVPAPKTRGRPKGKLSKIPIKPQAIATKTTDKQPEVIKIPPAQKEPVFKAANSKKVKKVERPKAKPPLALTQPAPSAAKVEKRTTNNLSTQSLTKTSNGGKINNMGKNDSNTQLASRIGNTEVIDYTATNTLSDQAPAKNGDSRKPLARAKRPIVPPATKVQDAKSKPNELAPLKIKKTYGRKEAIQQTSLPEASSKKEAEGPHPMPSAEVARKLCNGQEDPISERPAPEDSIPLCEKNERFSENDKKIHPKPLKQVQKQKGVGAKEKGKIIKDTDIDMADRLNAVFSDISVDSEKGKTCEKTVSKSPKAAMRDKAADLNKTKLRQQDLNQRENPITEEEVDEDVVNFENDISSSPPKLLDRLMSPSALSVTKPVLKPESHKRDVIEISSTVPSESSSSPTSTPEKPAISVIKDISQSFANANKNSALKHGDLGEKGRIEGLSDEMRQSIHEIDHETTPLQEHTKSPPTAQDKTTSIGIPENINKAQEACSVPKKRKATPVEIKPIKKNRSSKKGEETEIQSLREETLPVRRSPRIAAHTTKILHEAVLERDIEEKDPDRKPPIISFNAQGPRNQGLSSTTKPSVNKQSVIAAKAMKPPTLMVDDQKNRKRGYIGISDTECASRKRQSCSPAPYDNDTPMGEVPGDNCTLTPVVSSGKHNRHPRLAKPSSQTTFVAPNGSPSRKDQEDHMEKLTSRLQVNEEKVGPRRVSTNMTIQRSPSAVFGPKIDLGNRTKSRASSPLGQKSHYIPHENTADGRYMTMNTRELIAENQNIEDPFTGASRGSSDFANRLRKPHPGVHEKKSRLKQKDGDENPEPTQYAFTRKLGMSPNTPPRRRPAPQKNNKRSNAGPVVHNLLPTDLSSSSSFESKSSQPSDSPIVDKNSHSDTWNSALRPHYTSLYEATHRIADEILIRLAKSEERMGMLVSQYQDNGTKIVEGVLRKREKEKTAIFNSIGEKKDEILSVYADAKGFLNAAQTKDAKFIKKVQQAWEKKEEKIAVAIRGGKKVSE